MKYSNLLSLIFIFLLASCSTPKNISYFPELQTGSIVVAEQVKDIKVKPEDKLTINVSTQDQALTELFNLSRSTNTGSSQYSYFTVDSKGDINFPVVGKIHVAGLNREQVAAEIESRLEGEDLVKSPIVTVEFANTGIDVLGEVHSPGRYEFNKDHLTILDAIAMAGDLTINGVRENILVLRKTGEDRQEAYRINLLNAQELASSPVYYLQQDDLVYVEPNNMTKRNTTPNGNASYTPSFWISLSSVAMTVITLILTLSK